MRDYCCYLHAELKASFTSLSEGGKNISKRICRIETSRVLAGEVIQSTELDYRHPGCAGRASIVDYSTNQYDVSALAPVLPIRSLYSAQ